MIDRDDIVDYMTYEDMRDEIRPDVLEAKRVRRVRLGEHLTLLFENEQTLRYQVQEIVRVERMVRERDIQHEIEVYNGILGGPDELACVLLIEIEAKEDRKPLLTRWFGLQEHIYVRLPDDRRVYATYDPSQVGEDRLSAVQFLKFPVDQAPIAVGTDFEPLAAEVQLDDEQRAALAADLGVDPVIPRS